MSTSEEKTFDIQNLVSRDPCTQFKAWFDEAKSNPGIKQPNAACLATCSSKECKPTCRMMDVELTKQGFVFYTKYSSDKGREIEANKNGSLCFYWEPLGRQVMINGRVERLPREESKKHFIDRPFEYQVTSFISEQDEPVKSKQSLFDKYYKACKEFEKENKVPVPENWGGYLLVPQEIEFWQENVNHMADRIVFKKQLRKDEEEFVTKGEDGWFIERLSP